MIYVVQPGDTLYSLSRRFGTPVEEIAWLNQIPDPNVLVAGQALLILDGFRAGPLGIQVNGFAYPFVSPWVLRETLDNLNLLSVFSYGFTPEGDLLPPLPEEPEEPEPPPYLASNSACQRACSAASTSS